MAQLSFDRPPAIGAPADARRGHAPSDNDGRIVMTKMNRRIALALASVSVIAAAIAPTPVFAADESAANAALLKRYVAAFNAHDAAGFKDIVAENYIQHNGRAGQGLAGLQAAASQYFQTFPDFHMQLEDSVMNGDKVVARFTLTATHDHDVQLGPGVPTFPPTGKKLSWSGISIWRVADGKFAEHWDVDDLAGLARQMRGQ
jgi:predicted ester cyclase